MNQPNKTNSTSTIQDISWNLEDLYKNSDALLQDLDRVELAAKKFAKQYRTKIASLEEKALAKAIEKMEDLQDQLGRAYTYAYLNWCINTEDTERGAFLHKIRELTSKKNIILIFDEIRSGFRVDLGGAQKKYNVTPDLATFGKAMANGYSIAALTGKREILEVYSKKAFITGTYFGNSLSMAAALKTIEFIETNDVITDLNQKGEYFKKKMDDLIQNYNNFCEFSGSPWMPYLTFRRDKIYKKNREIFFTEMIRQKVFWQPYHHSYFCYRHTYDDIDYVLTCVENSLKKILIKNDV